MPGPEPKRTKSIRLDMEDIEWAEKYGFNFSQEFGAYLKTYRRYIEGAPCRVMLGIAKARTENRTTNQV